MAALVLATVAAAFAGPWEIEGRAFELPVLEGIPEETITADTLEINPELLELEDTARDGPSWLGVLAQALVIVAGAGLAFWLISRFLRTAALPGRRDTGAGPTLAVAPEPEVDALRRGVDDARSHLIDGGQPDDAIIAAWLSIEAAAESCGIERHPAQTPTEFTRSVLSQTAADPEATSTLLGLYHRARFSDQSCTTDDIATAHRCLGDLSASWDGVSIARMSP